MVQFNSDPGSDLMFRAIDAGERARKVREGIGVDTAIRRGLSQQPSPDPTAPVLTPLATAAAPSGGQAAPSGGQSDPSLPVPPPAQPPPTDAPAPSAPPSPLAPGPNPEDNLLPTATPAAAPTLTPSPNPENAPPTASAAPSQAVLATWGGGGSPAPTARAAAPSTGAAPQAPFLSPMPQQAAHPQQPGGRYDAVVRELATAPGGGVPALSLMQAQGREDAMGARRKDQLARLSMQAFSRGDLTTGHYFAQQAGLQNLPPQFGAGMYHPKGVGSGAQGGVGGFKNLAAASLIAKRQYPDDPEAAGRFTMALAQGGSVSDAFAAGGAPRGKFVKHIEVENADGTSQWVGVRADGSHEVLRDDDGNPLGKYHAAPGQKLVQTPQGYVLVDTSNGTASPVTNAGTGDQTQGRPGGANGGGPRSYAFQAKINELVSTGMDRNTAVLIATGQTVTPSNRLASLERVRRSIQADPMIAEPDKPAAIQAAVSNLDRLMAGGGPGGGSPTLAPRTAGAATGAAAPAAPAAPPPTDRATHPEHPTWRWSARMQKWMMPVPGQNGNWTAAQ